MLSEVEYDHKLRFTKRMNPMLNIADIYRIVFDDQKIYENGTKCLWDIYKEQSGSYEINKKSSYENVPVFFRSNSEID